MTSSRLVSGQSASRQMVSRTQKNQQQGLIAARLPDDINISGAKQQKVHNIMMYMGRKWNNQEVVTEGSHAHGLQNNLQSMFNVNGVKILDLSNKDGIFNESGREATAIHNEYSHGMTSSILMNGKHSIGSIDKLPNFYSRPTLIHSFPMMHYSKTYKQYSRRSTTVMAQNREFSISDSKSGEQFRKTETTNSSETQVKVSDLRKEYSSQMLVEADIPDHPMELFEKWFKEALASEVYEPNAMCLSTCGKDLQPSARFVLMKDYDNRGIVCYTNYQSRKSLQINDNPNAALTFWWGPLERQVRFEGKIELVSELESDAYFQSRPRGSQVGAWTSDQSRPIENREAIAEKEQYIKQKFESLEKLERPPHWGGWRLKPLLIEFWQGQPSRLHDRIVFTRENTDQNNWETQRLQP